MLACFRFLPLAALLSSLPAALAQPLHPYLFTADIQAAAAAGELRVSKAAQYYSYIGAYPQALSVPNEVPLEWGFDTLTQADEDYFTRFQPQPAVETLLDKAATAEVLMLNEAHHKPQHRVFTRSLLPGLYERGYRYLGLEALSNCASGFCDSTLNERGYALNSPITGTYVTEPQMGNLIREAIALGFEVFPYEQFSKDRERDQAQNIAAFMEAHPDGKVVLHCGWYHLLEAENRGYTYMAAHLRELTGADPLTVYQDVLVERHSTPESPFYRMVGTYEAPTVFTDAQGELYNGHIGFAHFDALVYHPRTTYQRNRPAWLTRLPGHQLIEVDSIAIGFPVLVKAYRAEEPSAAVPVDIIEKAAAWDPTALVLPPGAYRLVILNREGATEKRHIIVE